MMTVASKKTVVVTGIQPTGQLHLGNYFSVVKPLVEMQNSGQYDVRIFIADLHAMTSLHDREQLVSNTNYLLQTLVSLGIDPEHSTFWVQSDVPEITTVAWMLSSITPLAWMNKMHAIKAANESKTEVNVGLLTYPILQAADILCFGADLVPVGNDQSQHIEIARDVAQRYNNTFYNGKEHLKIPEPYYSLDITVPGTDGRKMSKSYNNTICPLDSTEIITKACKKIVTNSIPLGSPRNPDECHVFNIYSLFKPAGLEETRKLYTNGKMGSGDLKAMLAATIASNFEIPRIKRENICPKATRKMGAEKAASTSLAHQILRDFFAS